MVLGQIWAMTAKDLKILFRDTGNLVALFGIPVVFILFMTAASGGGGRTDRPFPLLVVNRDMGEVSTEALRKIEEIDSLKVVSSIDNRPITHERAEELIREGGYRLAIVFEERFSDVACGGDEVSGDEGRVTFLVDPALSNRFIGPVKSGLAGLIERTVAGFRAPHQVRAGFDRIIEAYPPANAALLGEVAEVFLAGMAQIGTESERPLVTFQQRNPENMGVRRPSAEQQTVPSYAIFGVFFIISVMAASLIQEKVEGTFRRLNAAPMSEATLLAGKLLPFFLVNLLQIAIMFLFGVLVYGLDLGSSPLGLLSVTLAMAASATGLGLLIATLGRTGEQVGGIATLLSIVLAAAGGMFIPTEIMPGWLQNLSLITPHYWALAGFQDIMVRGFGTIEVFTEIMVLTGFATVFYALALWRFRFHS